MRHANPILSLLALTLAACGSGPDASNTGVGTGLTHPPDSASAEDPTGPTDDTEARDLTAPYVVSVTPENGAVGVRADAEVTFTFSEPMDRTSVENSLLAGDLGDTTVSWNTAGDAVTVTPEELLDYAQGEGVNAGIVVPYRFHVVVGTGAEDLAGNAMGTDGETLFETLKEITTTFERDNALTGTATAVEQVSDADDFLTVGDDDNDECHRSFISFDMGMLPWTTVEVVHAEMEATLITEEIGLPYEELGAGIILDQVTFEAMDNAAFNADPHSEVGYLAVSGEIALSADVTAQVDNDMLHRLERDGLSQYRLRFEVPNNEDGGADQVLIAREDLLLTVTYLAE